MDANRLEQTKCPNCWLTSPNSLWDEETRKVFGPIILSMSEVAHKGEASFICPNCKSESDGLIYDDETHKLPDKDEVLRQQQAEIERLNRAYEVLEGALNGYAIMQLDGARMALESAQRIKEEKDGEQG